MSQKFENTFPKISIIMPFFNEERVIKTSIESVLDQTYPNWQLILVNDGSYDSSESVVRQYSDDRITYYKQVNSGVALARNMGLEKMIGEYFCFLDADDFLPPDSLMSRYKTFESNRMLTFVDGKVQMMDLELRRIKNTWSPNFNGNPLLDLTSLTGKSFFGSTWMIKRKPGQAYRMRNGLSHSEDLLFYLELSREVCCYGYTNDIILNYRDSPGSAMKNLEGLENGYRQVYEVIREWKELDEIVLRRYRARSKRIMFRSYLRSGKMSKALSILTDWL